MAKNFKFFKVIIMAREEKSRVDRLSKHTNTKRLGHNKIVIQETLLNPNINVKAIQVTKLKNDER